MPVQNNTSNLDINLDTKIKLEEIRLFNQVAELGSFSAAAKQIGITQPSASKGIRKLEERIGLTLFERTTRSVCLTALGEQFLVYSQRLAEVYSDMMVFTENQQIYPEGVLKIALPSWFIGCYMSSFIKGFSAKYPKLKYEFTSINAGNLHEASEFDADIWLHTFTPSDRKMNSRRLFEIPLSFYASKSYLSFSAPPENPEQLKQHPLLLQRVPYWQDEFPWTDNSGQRQTVRLKPFAIFDDFQPMLEVAMQGMGICFAPEALAQAMDLNDCLQRLSIPSISFHVRAFYPAKSRLTPKAQVFLDELSLHYQKVHS